MASYDEIVSNKSSLEFEINTYRRLLESEEAHVKKTNESSSAVHIRQTITTTHSRQQNDYPITQPQPPPPPPIIQKPIPTIVPDTKINQTEMQAKTTFQRSAKGLISSLAFLFYLFLFLFLLRSN